MERSNDWLVPLTGVAFVVVAIVSFMVGGEPKSADEPIREVVSFYVDNKDSVQFGAILSAVAALLLVVFGAYLRKVLHAAAGPGETMSLVAFAGIVIVATGIAIDATILFAASEAAGDVNPITVQALQALWDNDFIPFVLGVMAFLLGTGVSIIKSGVLPRWLGWVMIVLLIIGATPVGFVAAIASALLVLVLGIMLSIRARSTPSAA
jgi:hypothetical protein